MNDERKYLITMLIAALVLSGLAIWDGWLMEWARWKVAIGFAVLVAIYVLAFLVRRWYGRLLVGIHMLMKAPLPLAIGMTCGLIGKETVGFRAAWAVGLLPALFMILALIGYHQGWTPEDWHPKRSLMPFGITYAVFWFSSTLYVHIVTCDLKKRRG